MVKKINRQNALCKNIVSCILAFYRQRIRPDVEKLCVYPILEEDTEQKQGTELNKGRQIRDRLSNGALCDTYQLKYGSWLFLRDGVPKPNCCEENNEINLSYKISTSIV